MTAHPVSFVRETAAALVSGSLWLDATRSGRPLVVGLHGGGLTQRYFTEGRPSLVNAATARGFDVALFDRPGYGDSRFVRRDGDVLRDNAAALAEVIGGLRDEHAAGRPVVLIGHSIGGAIALLIAAGRPAWLGAVSVSGMGDVQPAAVAAMLSAPPSPDAPPPDLAHMIFLTPEAATDEAVAALGRAAAAALPEELLTISTIWPGYVLDVLGDIAVPTQILLAEHEALWETGAPVAERLAASLRNAARKDVAVFPGVAHCIEYHPEAQRILRQGC